MKKLTLLVSLIWLTGCATTFSSNDDPNQDKMTEYFSASKVRIYNNEQELPKPYKFLGLVEASDCQLSPDLIAPDAINARTNARQQAFKQKADAIIFTGCTLIEPKGCHQELMCVGKIYRTMPIDQQKARK